MEITTAEQVLALAPDEASAKAARGLLGPGKWPTLGQAPGVLWGECQGSGSKPYQVQVDTSGPAFRCTCPSRKFPCKHGLALMLQWVQRREGFAPTLPPAWVSDWLEGRKARAEKQEQKRNEAETAPKAVNEQAANRRAEQRWEQVTAGAADLQLWLCDRIHHGLAELTNGTDHPWRALAGRMVDAKAPGLAARVRQLESLVGVGQDWPQRLLAAMGRLQLLLSALEHLDDLAPPEQADVRAALGLAPDKEEVAAEGERVTDLWRVLGLGLSENDRLWERRAWLLGLGTGRRALLLDYAYGSRNFSPPLLAGGVLPATLAFYPGNFPLRALILEGEPQATTPPPWPPMELARELDWQADALAANPWQTLLPLILEPAALAGSEAGWWAVTPKHQFPLVLDSQPAWLWLAISGGQRGRLFGEWDGERLQPLGFWSDEAVWRAGP